MGPREGLRAHARAHHAHRGITRMHDGRVVALGQSAPGEASGSAEGDGATKDSGQRAHREPHHIRAAQVDEGWIDTNPAQTEQQPEHRHAVGFPPGIWMSTARPWRWNEFRGALMPCRLSLSFVAWVP
jgi:hypothetical protein